MAYREYAPHPLLADYIKCFWVMERDFQPLNGTLDILPDSYIELIFNTGSPCKVDDGQSVWELPDCYLVTLFDKPFRLRTTGVLKTIGVRFFAWGFFPLTGIHLDASETIHMLDSDWQNLTAHIATLESESTVELLQQHFIQYALRMKNHEPEVRHVSQRLFEQKGDVKIEDLVQESHLSRRQLERRFRTEVRMSPKTLALRMRFEHVRDQLCGNPESNLAKLAADYGYADQAHLSREFKLFSNRTLSQFIAEIRPMREDMRYGVAFPQAGN